MINVEVFTGFYSKEILECNPDKLFVFGDNVVRKGTGGQAVIRYQPNAFGIATKRFPSMREGSFFTDTKEDFDVVENDIISLLTLANSPTGPTIVFPAQGIGTGMGNMKDSSPKLWEHMNGLLLEYFDFDNNLSSSS